MTNNFFSGILLLCTILQCSIFTVLWVAVVVVIITVVVIIVVIDDVTTCLAVTIYTVLGR